jgi:hypothetical protein
MRDLARACIAGGMLALASSTLPAYLLLAGSPPQMSLTDRVAMARADLLARPCLGDHDCHMRIAAHGVDPTYYEGPDEWLEAGCLAKHDRTACAYLAAWREVEPGAQ